MRFAVLASVLIAGLALAGCTGEPGEPSTAWTGHVVRDPLDYSYLDNGTDLETGHVHDYWNGQDTLPVAGERWSKTTTCSGCSDHGIVVMDVQPPSGSIVPQGAAFLDIVFTWTEHGDSEYEGTEVWVKTAADAEARRVGPVESAVALRFESTNEQNDPPHHVLSLWRFELRFTGGQTIRFDGELSVQVTAVRGLEIPPWPPHPDHWGGDTEITLLDRDGRVVWYDRREVQGGTTTSCYMQCDLVHALDEGVIVPPRTGHVAVTLTFVPGAVPTGVGLVYHGADTWDMQPLEPVEADTLEWRYEIPIVPGRHDSPYALQSLWAFMLVLDQSAPVQAWHGDYHLTAVAHKA